MNIYNRSSLTAFYGKHPDCKWTLEKWYHDFESKKWKRPGDVTGILVPLERLEIIELSFALITMITD